MGDLLVAGTDPAISAAVKGGTDGDSQLMNRARVGQMYACAANRAQRPKAATVGSLVRH